MPLADADADAAAPKEQKIFCNSYFGWLIKFKYNHKVAKKKGNTAGLKEIHFVTVIIKN